MTDAYLITEVKGRQIIDSRGNPTVEAEVEVKRFEVQEDTGETFSKVSISTSVINRYETCRLE